MNDPRLDYQKQIDQVNRFYSILFFASFSLVIKVILDFDYILGLSINYAVLFFAAMLFFLASAWDKKIHLIISQKKAMEELMLQENPSFKWLVRLEDRQMKEFKPLAKWLDWPDVDIPLDRIMVFTSLLLGVFSVLKIFYGAVSAFQ